MFVQRRERSSNDGIRLQVHGVLSSSSRSFAYSFSFRQVWLLVPSARQPGDGVDTVVYVDERESWSQEVEKEGR